MKRILHIIIALLFFSCATHRKEQYSFYTHYSSDRLFNLLELHTEFNVQGTDPTSVKRVLIDMNTFTYYFKEDAFNALAQCKQVEYISIVYPNHYMGENLSTDISFAISKLPKLKALDISFDTLKTLPNYIKQNSQITEVRYFGNYVESVDSDILASSNLKYAQLNFRTADLKCDFTKAESLIILALHVNGKIVAPKLDSLDQLQSLAFYNDELEELPDDFFGVENLFELTLDLPMLKSLNPKIAEMKQLTGLSITSYKLDHLPEFLGEMTALTSVSLTTAGKIKSLAPLKKLPTLQSLVISGVDPMLVLGDILEMPALEYLHMSLPLLQGQELSSLQKLKKTPIKRIRFQNQCIIEENGEFVKYELDEQNREELYIKLKEILPRKYFRH